MVYSINTHIHNYSSWAASRAASVKNNRFTVEVGQQILSNSSLPNFILNPDELPSNQDEFNILHNQWQEEIIVQAKEHSLSFTHGVSAKLINVYLKSIIICGGFHDHPKAAFIHPPIDSVLLKQLATIDFHGEAKFWRKANKTAWSKFTSEEYEEVIELIRMGLNGKPLWTIEEFWQGYQ